MTEITTSHFFDGNAVRTVAKADGSLWFVGNDVCKALGINDARQALEKLDDDERGVCFSPTPSGPQEMRVISESGLYALVMRSRGAMTPGSTQYRFRKWVTGDVLPSIRKTGSYRSGDELVPNDVNDLMRVVQQFVRQREAAIEAERNAERARAEAEHARAESLLNERTQVIADMRAAERVRDSALRKLEAVAKHAYKSMRECSDELGADHGDLLARAEAGNVLPLLPRK